MSNCGRWEPTFCAVFVRIKLNSVVAVPWHRITRFCSTFAVDIPRPDKWHLVRIVLASTRGWSTERSNNFFPWEASELLHQFLPQSIWISHCPLHTNAKISRLSFRLFVSRTKYKIVGSSIVHCRCPPRQCFSSWTPPPSADGQTGIFHPTGSLALLSSGDGGMVPTLTLDGVVRCEQNVHSCALYYAHNFRAQFEIRLSDSDILLSHGQQWRMGVRSSAALRVPWIVATLSSYDWCLCPTKKIQWDSFIEIFKEICLSFLAHQDGPNRSVISRSLAPDP